MNKFIPLFLGLMFPLAGALADDFTDQAVEFCRSKGGAYSMGSMVEEGDKYCRQVTCKKTNGPDGRLQIPDGAAGPEANVEATKRVCISKSIVDGNFNTAGAGNSSGSASGSQSGSQSGAAGGSASGSASGSQSGAAGGSASGSASGAQSGVASGAAAGAGGAGGDGAIYCEELEGVGRIEPGGLCYNECKPKVGWKFWEGKKSGFERKSCIECLLKYPGVYRVKKEYLPKDKDGRVIGDRGVELGRGVAVRTGVIVCKDASGKIVTINGSVCPSGMTVYTNGGAVGGGGVGIAGGVGVGGGVGIAGGVAGGSVGGVNVGIAGGMGGGIGGGAGVQLPAYCNSTKQKDIEKCQEWMQQNRRFLCSSSANPSLCMGGADADIMARYDINNCVNCGAGGRRQSTLSGIAEIVGAIAPPLAMFGSAYVGAKAHQRSNEAWAGAAAAGFEQCRLDHNNYYQYLSANELPGLTPAQQQAMNCNGFGLHGYAGLQNPGLGGWYGAGYTPGFIGGMMGPYGGYNPYGMGGGYVGGAVGGMVGGIGMAGGMAGGYPGGYAGGMVGGYPGGMAGGMVGGMAGGFPGGYAGGYAGGYPGGMAGGAVNGISIAGGFNGGYAGGFAGGMAGGMAGGFPGGYAGGMAGGYPGGYAGGMAGGGYPGGFAGGMAGGAVNGISIAGGVGIAGGMNGGYAGGHMAGGYTPGGYAGGYMAGGMNGGYPGGYAGGGYAAGGYAGGMAGGMAGGFAGGFAGGADYGASQQAANYDRMMQQQGTAFQMGMGGMGGVGGYGSAGFHPANAGFSIGGHFGGGFGGW